MAPYPMGATEKGPSGRRLAPKPALYFTAVSIPFVDNVRRSRGREQASGEHDIDDLRNGVEPRPIALELTGQRHPADGLATRLHDSLEAGAVRLDRRAAHRVHDRVDLIAVPHRVQRRKRE